MAVDDSTPRCPSDEVDLGISLDQTTISKVLSPPARLDPVIETSPPSVRY